MLQHHHPMGHISWLDLTARDLDAIAPFYEVLMGWDGLLQDTGGGPTYLEFRRDDLAVAGLGQQGEATAEAGARPCWNTYVAVDDANAAVHRVLRAGGKVVVPVMTILAAGRLAFVADLEGAVLGLWEAGMHGGSQAVSGPGTRCWSQLACRDVQAAQRFYGAVFGWTIASETPDGGPALMVARCDGVPQGDVLLMTKEWGEMAPHWMPYFQTPDAAAACEQVRALGGRVHYGPFETKAGPIAIVADPEGAVFTLAQWSGPPVS